MRILNIGASISSGPHLQTLQDRFVEAGILDYDFVGPVIHPGTPRNTNRQAYGGMRLGDMLHGRTIEGVFQPGAIESVPKYEPDVILVLGGTNNIVHLDPGNLGSIQEEWNALVDYLTTQRPDAPVFISNITPVHPERKWSTKQPVIDEFNAWVKREIEKRTQNGEKLFYVDQAKNISLQDFREDGLHLEPSGQIKLGEMWFEALQCEGTICGAKPL